MFSVKTLVYGWMNEIWRDRNEQTMLTQIGLHRMEYVPVHDKTYNKTCATSEDSDQPLHPCSLIRLFADHMCLLQPLDYSKRDKPCLTG